MEIFTSMTFWAIVIAVIVILAIIGYVAEGTILANKNKKEEEKLKKTESTTWTEETPTEAEIKQEKVYTVTDNNWLEMPDINAGETIALPPVEPSQTPAEPTPAVEPAQTPVEPAPAVEPVQVPVEPAPDVEPVQVPVEPTPVVEPVQVPVEPIPAVKPVQVPVEPVQTPVEPAVGPAPTIEPIQVPVETLQPQTNTINSQSVEKQDVWTN